MPVVSVTEQWSSRSATQTYGSRGLTREFEVITDTPADNEYVVLNDSRVPRVGDPYPSDYWMKASKREPSQAGGPMRWLVRVEYVAVNVPVPYGSGPSEVGDPTQWLPEIEWDSVDSVEDIDRDLHDKPIATPVDEVFTGIKREWSDQVLRVTVNQATFNAALARSYANCVNSDPFFGAVPGQVKMRMPKARKIYDTKAGYIYYRIVYEFTFREQGWKKRILNEGLLRKTGWDQKVNRERVEEFTDDSGRRASKPVRLTSNGYELPKGAKAIWLEFEIYPSVAFAPLGLKP